MALSTTRPPRSRATQEARAREIAFAPKDLRTAQDLAERLGSWTYSSTSRSRPAGLSQGHRTNSDSDQRRLLMLPQELFQMPSDQLIALRANLPPILGTKIVYWRDKTFSTRVRPPPVVAPHPQSGRPVGYATAAPPDPSQAGGLDLQDLTLSLGDPWLAAAELDPAPPEGATVSELEAWVDRYIDACARTPSQDRPETRHGR